MTSSTHKTLQRIALENGLDFDSMYIEKDAVFYRQHGQLLSCCQVNSEYWNEISAIVLTQELIDKVRRK